MTDELIDELFAEFKNDEFRWAEFARREDSYSRDGVEEPPGRAAIVHEFVRERLGTDHGYEVGGLIIKIRKSMRGVGS